MAELFITATMVRWVAEDHAAGLVASGREVVHRHDLGLDVPDVTVDGQAADAVSWWASAAHTARVARAGVRFDVAAPGPRFTAELPAGCTRRGVWAGTLADLAAGAGPRDGHCKVAEAKTPGLDAAVWADTSGFVTAARAARVPDGSVVQVSEPVRFVEEHRCVVVDATVTTTSPYLDDRGGTYESGWEHDDRFAHQQAAAFAADVAASVPGPVAYTLDVGRLDDGSWAVVEANPIFSSGHYGCDLAAFTAAVVAGTRTPVGQLTGTDRPASRHGRWVWQPDPYLVDDAARKVLLGARPRIG